MLQYSAYSYYKNIILVGDYKNSISVGIYLDLQKTKI